jgi:DNA-binding CsgD family transcriptional regulator
VSRYALLTRREHEVVVLVAEGLTNAEIGVRLWIAAGTVRRHLENVYAKLGVHTRTAAVRELNGAATDVTGSGPSPAPD